MAFHLSSAPTGFVCSGYSMNSESTSLNFWADIILPCQSRISLPLARSASSGKGAGMSKPDITIKDNRTGKTYDLDLELGALKAGDLRQIKRDETDAGLLSYDPAFVNTAATKSAITLVDGEAGQLRYRGYPIQKLAESSTFLETAYLILFGELPSPSQLQSWQSEIGACASLPKEIERILVAFPTSAHPMGMLISSVAALGTHYPGARDVDDQVRRMEHIRRLIAVMPMLAAFSHRVRGGLPLVYPDPNLGYAANLLQMLFKPSEGPYSIEAPLARALDVLFILHADHEQNCSTNVMRGIGSSKSDPYSSLAGAAAALYGPLHGGANEAVVRMLERIKDKREVPAFVERVKAGEFRLMGFGHRVYKNYDPRARIIKQVADEVFEITGPNPLLEIALELERIALKDDYFISRRLYPNVDFYSGIIYQAMGLPVEMFTAMFAIGRTVGWLAQWQELLTDPEQRIARPRQLYIGQPERSYVPLEKR
jgi:citrate synthase